MSGNAGSATAPSSRSPFATILSTSLGNGRCSVAGTSGRYGGRIDGVDGEAGLIFTVRGPSLISADHTEAPASMRGTGAAMSI